MDVNYIIPSASSSGNSGGLMHIHYSRSGWLAERHEEGEWFQFTFRENTLFVTASTTWGKEDVSAWVSSYSLQCTLYKNSEPSLLENPSNGGTTFEGNSDASSPKINALILSQCDVVRLNVLEWTNFIAMRWRLTFCHRE